MAGEEVHEHRGLRSTVHERTEREGHHRLVARGRPRLVELLEPVAAHEVDAATEHPPEVGMAPHHALREAGRAAGVDDVEVVVGALLEVAIGALARERVGPLDPAVRRDVGRRVRLGRVRDGHHRLQPGVLGCGARHERSVGTLVQERDDVGVVEDVVELALDVAVVHVDHDGPDLEDREQRDDVLDAVLGVDPDMVAGSHAAALEEVREPVGVGLQLGVRHDPVGDLDDAAVRNDVDGVLEEIGDVEGHVGRLEHVLISD